MIKTFESWMKQAYDEPDWHEGWNRNDMEAAYEAGQEDIGKAVVAFVKEELGNMNFESDDEIIEYILEHGK